LVTAPPGYALRAAPEAVDAWRFEAAVGEAGRLLTAGRPEQALAGLEDALALWRGPAYAEFARDSWARGEINRLDDLRMLAVERRGEALLALGQAAEAAFDLEAHTSAHPLREDAWQLLATALYRSGRQGEALAALRRARETLVAELGLDPGPRLRQLEIDILAQAPHLSAAAAPAIAQPSAPPGSTAPSEPGGAVALGDEQRPFLAVGTDRRRPHRVSLRVCAGHAIRRYGRRAWARGGHVIGRHRLLARARGGRVI
jgi:DNA-binding SARP family transcriptional activator